MIQCVLLRYMTLAVMRSFCASIKWLHYPRSTIGNCTGNCNKWHVLRLKTMTTRKVQVIQFVDKLRDYIIDNPLEVMRFLHMWRTVIMICITFHAVGGCLNCLHQLNLVTGADWQTYEKNSLRIGYILWLWLHSNLVHITIIIMEIHICFIVIHHFLHCRQETMTRPGWLDSVSVRSVFHARETIPRGGGNMTRPDWCWW